MNKRFRTFVVITAFLLASVWFFFPVGKPDGESLLFAMRLALPATLLALGGIGLLPWLMSVGFCFCAVGDAMGVIGSFEGQMGGFAVAHVCFISQFLDAIAPRRATKARTVRDIRQSKPRLPVFFITSMFCILPLVLAALKIIPAIHDLPIRIGCIVYALLLTGTTWTGIVRAFYVRSVTFIAAIGGLLFLVSDFILSWNKFTAHVPQASLYIMTTYYAALLCLFIGTLTNKRP